MAFLNLVTYAVFSLAVLISCLPQFSQAVQCSNEVHRPRYHFSPHRNWINDPNGMFWYGGLYHLFYQYHPNSSIWGPMHWGHAVSSDMITWEELPIALYPDENGMIFSGSAVVDKRNTSGFASSTSSDPVIVAIFTSTMDGPSGVNTVQRQSIAYSSDKGLTFVKYENNPVLADPTRLDFRDPKVTWISEGDQGLWMMSLAVGDKIEFFSSPDFKSWKLESEFGADPPQGGHGGVWECPDLVDFDVDGKRLWVLIVSINPGGPNRGSASQYFVGNFSRSENGNYSFSTYPWSPNQWLDWGPDDYAGVTFSNEPDSRHIYIGWMNNWMYANDLPTDPWRGQMTIPRIMSLVALNPSNTNDPGYRVASTPVPELDVLRNPSEHLEVLTPINLAPQNMIFLSNLTNFTSSLMEIEISLEMASQQPKFSICAFNSLREEHCFGFNSTNWYLDRSKSGNTGFHSEYQQTLNSRAVRELTTRQTNIRLFIDVSSMEAFADDGLTAMTALHYPTQPFDQIYINNWGNNGDMRINKVNFWGLKCSMDSQGHGW